MKSAIILQNAMNAKNRTMQDNNKQAELPRSLARLLVSAPT
jgi:hypothetical protein